MLYGAEMDGINSEVEHDLATVNLNTLNFVELKVKLRAETAKQKTNYRKFKLRNWWCQCFLVKIRTIIIGERNNNGIVSRLLQLDTRNISKEAGVSIFYVLIQILILTHGMQFTGFLVASQVYGILLHILAYGQRKNERR